MKVFLWAVPMSHDVDVAVVDLHMLQEGLLMNSAKSYKKMKNKTEEQNTLQKARTVNKVQSDMHVTEVFICFGL